MPDSRGEPRPGDPPCSGGSIGRSRWARHAGPRSSPRPAPASRRCSRRTATGCSSSRPMRRSRPNTSSSNTSSARSTRRSRTGSRPICARGRQEHGGWPLYGGGDFDLSTTVKAYYALELIGDDPDAPHMARARAAILARGGAARASVFTRISLALFGQVPWRAVPVMPVEIMLLPRWFPFHLDKVSYWSRTLIVPLAILMAHKPRAQSARRRNPGAVRHPSRGGARLHPNPTGSAWGVSSWRDRPGLRLAEPFFPGRSRGARSAARSRSSPSA